MDEEFDVVGAVLTICISLFILGAGLFILVLFPSPLNWVMGFAAFAGAGGFFYTCWEPSGETPETKE